MSVSAPVSQIVHPQFQETDNAVLHKNPWHSFSETQCQWNETAEQGQSGYKEIHGVTNHLNYWQLFSFVCVAERERNLCLLFSYFLFPVAYACDSFIFANGLPSSVAINEDIVIKDFFVVI